jgi:glutamate-1-semialdehyde 2,1-aminomutase
MDAAALFERAKRVIPGGVNSPVRAFQAVGGDPVYVTAGRGAYLKAADGRKLVDFCCSWGPLILGHAHPKVVEAVTQAAGAGMSFGINTPAEVVFAEMICDLVPSMDQVRLVSSGTEATMTALRLSRGVTGRQKILKFDGCYHGHADTLLVSAGSGLLTNGIASSAGVGASVAADVLVVPYNDLAAVSEVVGCYGDELAAIIVEPVAGNMGLVPPTDGFLEGLRRLADHCGAVLIFDEVITGFRLGPTTYGELVGVEPDLTCLGKVIGGGMPMGAVGGKRSVMEALAPLGSVYQAGTLSGNPVAVAAGLTTLQLLQEELPYERMAGLVRRLVDGVMDVVPDGSPDLYVSALGSMFTLFFQTGPVHNLTDARRSDTQAHARYFHGMLERGIYLPPSQFEVQFVSAAHTEGEIDRFIEAVHDVMAF